MAPCSSRRVDDRCVIVDPAGFDLSDADEVDIVGGAFPDTDRVRPSPDPTRADRSDDVLALCALMVFKDRRRRSRQRAGSCALPGI
jgi:hypothetical protein